MDIRPYEHTEAHSLVEEFMLLANLSVAKMLTSSLEEGVIVRTHSGPDAEKIKELIRQLDTAGHKLDTNGSHSQSLHKSIQKIMDNSDCITREAIIYLASNIMSSAEYKRTSFGACKSEYHHYALNFPVYTYFTSPIRRYADVIVHRQLTNVIKGESTPTFDITQICQICNETKKNSDRASRESARLHLYEYFTIRPCGVEKGIVVELRSKSVTILVPKYDVRSRVDFDNETYQLEFNTNQLLVKFREAKISEEPLRSVTLSLLSIVDVQLIPTKENCCQTVCIKLVKPARP